MGCTSAHDWVPIHLRSLPAYFTVFSSVTDYTWMQRSCKQRDEWISRDFSSQWLTTSFVVSCLASSRISAFKSLASALCSIFFFLFFLTLPLVFDLFFFYVTVDMFASERVPVWLEPSPPYSYKYQQTVPKDIVARESNRKKVSFTITRQLYSS